MSYFSSPVKYDLYIRNNAAVQLKLPEPKLNNMLSYVLFKTSSNQPFNLDRILEDFKSYVSNDIQMIGSTYSPEAATERRIWEGWEASRSTTSITVYQELSSNPNQQFTNAQWNMIFKRIPIWKNILSELKKYVTSFPLSEPNIEALERIVNNYMHIARGSDIFNDMMITLLGIYDSLGTLGPSANPWSRERSTTDNTVNVLEKERDGYLYKWYAWAAQFWLPKQHQSWFQEIYRISHSDDVNSLHRLATVVIVDDASDGLKQFVEVTMQPLNMPSLKYVNICINDDQWWISPQQNVNKINVKCKVTFDSIEKQDDRSKHLQKKIDALENIKDVVILYTSSCDLLGYCLYKQVNVYVETPWCGPVSIESLEQQVCAQTNLLGPATRYAKINTKRLTFICLMMFSISHGMPMYVSVGWNRTLTEWYKIVKEYKKPVNQQTADEDCIWLAKEYDDGIVLNQPIFMTLIVRLLNTAFTPDKKVVTGNGGTGYLHYLKRHYTEMKDENRLGSGKVKPVLVEKQYQQMVAAKSNTLGKNPGKDKEYREVTTKLYEIEQLMASILPFDGSDYSMYKINKELEKHYANFPELRRMTIKQNTDIGELTHWIDQEKKNLTHKKTQEMSKKSQYIDVDAANEGYVQPEDELFDDEDKGLKEWMYGQRLIFINNYYCPRDLDELLRIFRIRLKDWTGVSKISINL